MIFLLRHKPLGAASWLCAADEARPQLACDACFARRRGHTVRTRGGGDTSSCSFFVLASASRPADPCGSAESCACRRCSCRLGHRRPLPGAQDRHAPPCTVAKSTLASCSTAGASCRKSLPISRHTNFSLHCYDMASHIMPSDLKVEPTRQDRAVKFYSAPPDDSRTCAGQWCRQSGPATGTGTQPRSMASVPKATSWSPLTRMAARRRCAATTSPASPVDGPE